MEKIIGKIESISNIAVAIATVVLPIIIYNFKRENIFVKKKTKKGELIDLYGIFLIVPILSLLIQLGIRNQEPTIKDILIPVSFLLPIEIVIILGYNSWKFIKTNNANNINRRGFERYKNIIIAIINIFLWMFYSLNILTIVYLSNIGMSKHSEIDSESLALSITMYFTLAFLYIFIGKLLIGTYKRSYATKIRIDYHYKGNNIKKEISFRDLKTKGEYVSFYIENEKTKYFIPWDKINDIKIYYN